MKKFLFTLLSIIVVVAGYFLINKNMSKINSVPTNRLTYTGDGFKFQYPGTFGADVRHATNRPPKVMLIPTNEDPVALGCPLLKNSGDPLSTSTGKTQYGVSFTLYTWWDAGAWSLYSSYCYVMQGKNNFYVVDFEIRSHTGCENGQCGAYCETQFEQECRAFDLARDVEKPIKTIISTFNINQ